MTVNEDVRALINEGYEAGKPMAFICIAPVLAAAVLGRTAAELELTIGDDPATASAIEGFGASHVITGPGHIHVDAEPHCIDTCVDAWTEHCSGIRGHDAHRHQK